MDSPLGKRLAFLLILLLVLAAAPGALAAGPVGSRDVIPGGIPQAAHTVSVAAIDATVTVSNGTAGWENVNWDGAAWSTATGPTGTQGVFVNAPAVPVLGSGSFRQIIGTDGDEAQRLQYAGLNGMLLSAITELKYSTYVTANLGGQASYLQLAVDYTGDGLTDDRLFFEPVYQTGSYSGTTVPDQCPGIYNCVALNTWQTWDALAGGWWLVSGAGGPPLITLADFIAAHPTAALAADGFAFRLQAGGGAGAWDNFDGFVDNLKVNGTTYDLELIVNTAWVDDDYTAATPGWGVDHFTSIQAGIDAVAAGGTVNVYPGTYNETAASRYLYSNVGPYQFGLFFADEKPGVTVQGLKADGSPITAYTDVAATVKTNATNSFGYSGVFVEADNTTIAGLRIGPNAPSDNKTVEVIGENFTLKNSVIDVPGGGSVYINDWRYDDGTDTSYVTKYTVEGNWLKYGSSVDISSGAGVTGLAADRKVINNKFTADGDTPYWALVSFNGIVPSVGWFTYPVGGATVTGNDFSGSTQYIRSRGTVAGGFDWASYWTSNMFDKAVLATIDGNPANPRAFDYMSGTYLINNTLRIGAAIQPEVDIAQAGDTILVKAGTYIEQVALNKALTLEGANAGTPGQGTRVAESVVDANLVSAAFAIGADNVIIDGFKVQKGGGNLGCGIHAPAAHAGYAIRNNIITDNVMGIYANSAGAAVIENNLLDANNRTGPSGGAGIYSEYTKNLTIDGNKITGHTQNNPAIFAATDPGVHDGLVFSNNELDNAYGVFGLSLVNAKFQGNTIRTAGVRALTLADGSNHVDVLNNDLSGNDTSLRVLNYGTAYGIAADIEVHGNNLSGNATAGIKVETGAYVGTLNAENNWWGSACGPAASYVSDDVDYDPWWTDAAGTGTASGDGAGGFQIPANASTATQNTIIACAAGKTVTYMGNPAAGGVVVNTNGVTINLNGFTVGAGSPAFTINADDVTLQGPGTLDGNDVASPAVLVNAGADNFTLKDVEVRKWADGVEIAGDVVSLKIVDNFIWDNADAGLQVNSGVNIDGVINIYGNLFKVNGGNGIQNDGDTADLPAQYNSWGDIGGPATGDGVSSNVDAANPTFLEYFIDMDPDTLATARRAGVGTSFDVMVKGDARKVNGIAFKVAYDNTVLQLNTATYQGTWAGATCLGPTLATGSVKGTCYLQTGEWDGDAAPIMKLNFTVLALPSSPYPSALDILHAAVDTNAGAYGGAKVYVNNAGYGLPSVPERDITDTDDGTLVLGYLANYTGFIDLQGRTNDSGATLLAKNVADKLTSINYASGTSVSSGAYTTAHLPPWMMFQGETFWFQVDRALYLPTTQMGTTPSDSTIPGSWVHSKPLSSIPTTPLLKVVLLGGDGTDDNVIDVLDAGCMGMSYYTASTCTGGAGANSDVNGDGVTDILDLSLMGGNFYKVESPWTP